MARGKSGTGVCYLDLAGTPQPTEWDEIFESVKRIHCFFQAVGRRFVERDYVIKQIMHAMMLREHIMLSGPTGTAKTMLIKSIFSGIEGATVWSMDLTKFTTDTKLLGSYDVRKMKETGQMIHMTEGSLGEAHFAQTGEFFDANDAALRSLLGALNERVVQNGPQIIRLPLITTIADTNFDPEKLHRERRERLLAVIDRFLFRVPVLYVQEPRNRLSMLEMSLDNVHGLDLPPVSLRDFELVSGIIRGMNLVTDPYIVQAYEEMTRRFSEKRVADNREPLSDRRFVRAAQIMEVSAMLAGRTTAAFEDLEAAGFILATSDEDREMLQDVRKEVLAGWIKRSNSREIEADLHRLGKITESIPEQSDTESMNLSQLDRFAGQIEQTIEDLQNFGSVNLEVGKRQVEILHKTLALSNQVGVKIIERLDEMLPEIPEKPPVDQLTTLMQQVNAVLAHLKRVNPKSEVAMIKKSVLYEKIIVAKANLETAFTLANIPEPADPALEGEGK